MLGSWLVTANPETSPSGPKPQTTGKHSNDAPDNPFSLDASWEFNHAALEIYQGWIGEVRAQSATGGNCALIINKSAYMLYVIDGGDIVGEYPIELGFDPVHDKRMEGDGTTPEGIYHLTYYLDRGQTRFYRGYFIDYPSDLDREEFAKAQAQGTIPGHATIGGDIMIHGAGSGKTPNSGGYNWTLGCIALSDEDIDTLWPSLYQGMPVAIVRYGHLLLEDGHRSGTDTI